MLKSPSGSAKVHKTIFLDFFFQKELSVATIVQCNKGNVILKQIVL